MAAAMARRVRILGRDRPAPRKRASSAAARDCGVKGASATRQRARPASPSVKAEAGMPEVEDASTTSGPHSASSRAKVSRFTSTRSGPFSCTCAAPSRHSSSVAATATRAATTSAVSLINPAACKSANRARTTPIAASEAPAAGSQIRTGCPARANTIAQALPISPAPTTAIRCIRPSFPSPAP